MSWWATIGAGFTLLSQWMSRAWGEQTREQARLQHEVEEAIKMKRLAMVKARNAENLEQLKLAYDELNYWDTRLHELYTHALAKWG